MAVDVNGDGIIQATPHEWLHVDQTSAQTPYLLWVNADQDDLEQSETWPIARPDYSTRAIDSLRDIEDFRQLVIHPGSNRNTASLALRLDTESDLKLNFYASVDADCTNQPLLDAAIAERQLDMPRLGSLQGNQTLSLPTASCLLFEAAGSGAGSLQLVDRVGRAVAEPLYLEARPVKAFYRRTKINWSAGSRAPWEYHTEQPPDPNLNWVEDPQGVAYQKPWNQSDQVLVWVYGWQKQGEESYHDATVRGGETIYKRLWHRGFRGLLVFLHWPTIKPKLAYGLMQSEYRALKSGPALVNLVDTFKDHGSVHVTAHSLGNVMLLEALKLGMQPDDALFQVAAVPAGALDARDSLVLPSATFETPDLASDFGYRGYLTQSKVRISNIYNPYDHTWFGWNLMQKIAKPTRESGAHYESKSTGPLDQRHTLRFLNPETEQWLSRPVVDPHEVMAFIAQSRTQPLGGEARVQGLVRHRFDIGRAPYLFGHGHTVGWSWTPQRTKEYFELILDVFNIAHTSTQR